MEEQIREIIRLVREHDTGKHGLNENGLYLDIAKQLNDASSEKAE